MPLPERLTRTRLLLGDRAVERLRASFVAVIGLGAAGSYAAEALARAGVGRLRLVDFDRVRETNQNRMLWATRSTLGRPKAEVARERLRDVAPDAALEALCVFVHRDTLDQVLAGPPDLVVDAIDSLAPKVALIQACQARAIPIISCMGAARRLDPAAVRFGLLAESKMCPLAQRVRKALRKIKASLDVPCVYSVEEALAESQGPEDEPEETRRGRARKALGSLPTIPGIIGLIAAHHAILTLSGFRPGFQQD
ncbi:MAG: tRNA threonylcarbamoyladenosine dehydratase [Myxococcales bacterium]|nr:tRNA threonylcarbamoyladenosine dehydratase [Myxococcales bacterium]